MRLAGAGDSSYDAGGDRSTVRHAGPSGRHRMLDVEV
jgi:hypothetical protein